MYVRKYVDIEMLDLHTAYTIAIIEVLHAPALIFDALSIGVSTDITRLAGCSQGWLQYCGQTVRDSYDFVVLTWVIGGLGKTYVHAY